MICRTTGKQFEVEDQELQLLRSLRAGHPILKEDLPLPDLAPMEFLRQFACWGNLLNLFKSKSSFSDTPLLSRYNPALPYRVCSSEEFWSEKIDNTEYGMRYDFSRSFFEQYDELLRSIYWIALSNPNCEGSEYVNGANGAKDSYLCFGIFNSEACLYCYMVSDSTGCLDCVNLVDCTYCYDSHTLKKCYECIGCTLCSSCSECLFCEDCIGSRNCIFCFGLRNAEYMIENKKVSKEEYYALRATILQQKRSEYESAKKRFTALLLALGHTTSTLMNCEDSSGYCLINTKNVTHSFYTDNAQDCGHIYLSHECRDIWRGTGEHAELSYQASSYFNAYCSYNCYTVVGGNFNLYSTFLYNGCSHCFGCSSLNKKSYCILNTQYSKDEYYDLVPRIIAHMKTTGEWGRFFPPQIAPHYFEHSFSNDWMISPTNEEALKYGYKVTPQILHNGATPPLPTAQLCHAPNSLQELPADILSITYHCTESGKPFKIQKRELDFYLRFNLPPPTLHWQQRLLQKTKGTIRD